MRGRGLWGLCRGRGGGEVGRGWWVYEIGDMVVGKEWGLLVLDD